MSGRGEPEIKRLKYESADAKTQALPVVATFSNGVPSEGTVESIKFNAYAPVDSKKMTFQLFRGDSGPVVYEGRGYFGSNNVPASTGSQKTRLVIGVLNKKTGECKLVETVGPVVLHQTVKKQEHIVSTEDAEGLDVRSLIKEFGAKRKVRQIKQRETYRATADKVKGHEAVKATLAENSKEEVSVAALEDAYNASRNLPPHNALAILPKDVYPLHKLFPTMEMDACTGEEFFDAATKHLDRVPLCSPYTYVQRHLRSLSSRHSSDRNAMKLECRILQYLHYLIHYHCNPRILFPRKTEDGQRVPAENPFDDIPQVIASKLSHRFTEKIETAEGGGRRIRTRLGDALLIEWIICLALHVDQFSLTDELLDLANDMKMQPISLMAYCKELGLSVDRVSKKRDRPESEDESASSSSAAKYLIKLSLPLKFQSMPQKRTNRPGQK